MLSLPHPLRITQKCKLIRATFSSLAHFRHHSGSAMPRPLPENVPAHCSLVSSLNCFAEGTMRYASVASGIAILVALLAPSAASASQNEFVSRAAVIEWIDNYRNKPEPSRVPDAVRALSTSGALREPETAGFYVGFVAGVLGANPVEAEHLMASMLPLPPADQWLVVRAIAYSGLPAWESLLARIAAKVPARRGMIDAYLTGALPTLDAIELDKSPTFLEQVGAHFGVKHKAPAVSYGRNPELVDTLWGQYFAAGQ